MWWHSWVETGAYTGPARGTSMCLREFSRSAVVGGVNCPSGYGYVIL